MRRVPGPGLGFLLVLLLLPSCGKAPPLPLDARGLAENVAWLAAAHPSRLAGGPAEEATGAWLAAGFRRLGLRVEVETFPVLGFSPGKASFSLEGKGNLEVQAFLYSPATPSQGIEVPLVDAGWGLGSDLAGAGGRILVLHRRGSGLLETAEAAAAAGALGLLVLDPGRPTIQGYAGPHPPLPMAELGGQAARTLAQALEAGLPAPRGKLVLQTKTAKARSRNVIALVPGKLGRGGAILVGAHLDSVDTPGAEDNASGLACLLGLAARLAREPLDRDVYLVGFGAEEVGEEGSKALVRAWIGREPAAVLILDTVGSGSLTMVYSLRAEANPVTLAATRAALDLGLRAETGGSENSDHLPFALAGIPAAFIMRLPEERRHSAGDRAEFVDPQALVETRDLALATLGLLGGKRP